MAALTLAPPAADGTPPPAEGFRIWFEPPHHGWLFPHVECLGKAEFVCRASDVENDFLSDLVAALQGILGDASETRAEAFAEPQSFSFRFTRGAGAVRCDIVTYNRFSTPVVEEPILGISANGDDVCRAFCFGLRALQQTAAPEAYLGGYSHPFPTAALATLCTALGGEFADGNAAPGAGPA